MIDSAIRVWSFTSHIQSMWGGVITHIIAAMFPAYFAYSSFGTEAGILLEKSLCNESGTPTN